MKDIYKNYLQHNYASPDICKVRFTGIDEFTVHKGHVYKTIVFDFETGHVIYVGDDNGTDALDKFFRRVKKYNVNIEYVTTDLSAVFISAVKKNLPKAQLVFDHFHVKKIVNDKVDKLRRSFCYSRFYKGRRRYIITRNITGVSRKERLCFFIKTIICVNL